MIRIQKVWMRARQKIDTSDRDQESETFEEDVLSENTQTSVGFSAIELYEAKEVEETSTEEETKEEEQDFSGLVIARVNNYVNVKKYAK